MEVPSSWDQLRKQVPNYSFYVFFCQILLLGMLWMIKKKWCGNVQFEYPFCQSFDFSFWGLSIFLSVMWHAWDELLPFWWTWLLEGKKCFLSAKGNLIWWIEVGKCCSGGGSWPILVCDSDFWFDFQFWVDMGLNCVVKTWNAVDENFVPRAGSFDVGRAC